MKISNNIEKLKLELKRLENIKKSSIYVGEKITEFLNDSNLIKRSEYINLESIKILNEIKTEIISYNGTIKEEKKNIKLIQSIISIFNDIRNIGTLSSYDRVLYKRTREKCIKLFVSFQSNFLYAVQMYAHKESKIRRKLIKLHFLV